MTEIEKAVETLKAHADWLKQWSLAADSDAQMHHEQAVADAIRVLLAAWEEERRLHHEYEADMEKVRQALGPAALPGISAIECVARLKGRLKFLEEVPEDDGSGWCLEHERRFQANSAEDGDRCEVCRADDAERERDEARAEIQGRVEAALSHCRMARKEFKGASDVGQIRLSSWIALIEEALRGEGGEDE